jgi:hypothetical protein
MFNLFKMKKVGLLENGTKVGISNLMRHSEILKINDLVEKYLREE